MAAMVFLKRNFFLVKELKSLDVNSKQYKKKFRTIKSKVAPLIVDDFRKNVAENEALSIKQKHRNLFILCFSSIAFTFVSIILCLILGGNSEIKDMPEQVAAFFIFFFVTTIVSVLLAMFFALWAGHYVTQYLIYLINKFNVDMHAFSEERLHDIIDAEQYGCERIEENELCGCYYCLKTFLCDTVFDEYEEALCPNCNNKTIISENSGYPVNDEFLKQMHEFWIDD